MNKKKLEEKLLGSVTTTEKQKFKLALETLNHQTEAEIIIRARIQLAEENETPSKLFYTTEAKKQSQNTIIELKNGPDKTTSDRLEIQNIVIGFYESLWGNAPTLKDEDLEQTVKNIHVLEDTDESSQSHLITLQEVGDPLKTSDP